MKSVLALLAAGAQFASAAVSGMDISHYQGTNYNFAGAYSSGARFVIIKATEGTTYTDPQFSANYIAATNAGFIRGGYHFARPADSTGAAQAKYFVSHGGGWSSDGITLPGMLDLEYGSSSACHGLSVSAMNTWIASFINQYRSLTGAYPMIYTTADWWKTCTGDSQAWNTKCPLVLARYSSSVGTIPGGWPYQTIWQFNDSYKYGGDSDTFNGDLAGLKRLAKGS
uniref:Lysozyme n=1 Tax=Westerdykella sp. TaxID=1968780 RepID=A0A7S6G7X7_9PLEO|nr:GH25 muramidase [Westerdykella sp.]